MTTNDLNKLRESKKETIGSGKSRSKGALLIVSGALIAIGLIVFIIYASRPQPVQAQAGKAALVKIEIQGEYPKTAITAYPIEALRDGDYLVIPIEPLKKYFMVKFSFDKGDEILPLTAYLMDDGTVITAVAMCEPCRGKSFHLEYPEVVCDACGTRWRMGTHVGVSGGCMDYPPSFLPGEIRDDKVFIPIKSIEEWEPRI